MRTALTTILALTLSLPLAAQQAAEVPGAMNFIGLAWTSHAGSGISYRRAITPALQVGVKGYAFMNEREVTGGGSANATNEDYFIWNLGLEAQPTLFRTNRLRVFATVGGNVYENDTEITDSFGTQRDVRNENIFTYAAGAGAGAEWRMGDRFFLELGAGLQYTRQQTETSYTSPSRATTTAVERGIYPMFDLALHFGF